MNPRFLTTRNLINVLRQSSINGIVTVGVCWMMISGSFDLSVGAIVSLISVTMVAMLEGGSGIATTIIFGLGIGLATGIFNGFLVGRLKANPMLTTLGTMTIFQGIALLSAGGYYYRVPRNSPFLLIADGFIGPFAVPTIIFLVLALIMHLILSETSLGARVYAIGGNEEAAKLAGVRVPLYRTLMYVATGVCSAVAAMVGQRASRLRQLFHWAELRVSCHHGICPGWKLHLWRQRQRCQGSLGRHPRRFAEQFAYNPRI